MHQTRKKKSLKNLDKPNITEGKPGFYTNGFKAGVVEQAVVWRNECLSLSYPKSPHGKKLHNRGVTCIGWFLLDHANPSQIVTEGKSYRSQSIQNGPRPCNRSLWLPCHACCQAIDWLRGIHRERNCAQPYKREEGKTTQRSLSERRQIPLELVEADLLKKETWPEWVWWVSKIA